ncbi:MAG: transporter [Deferribacterales bacterium]
MENNNIKRILIILFLFLCAGYSFATEGGGQASANGPEGTMGGTLPPPGLYFINYVEYMSSDRFNNSDGDSVVPGFKLKGFAETLRFVYVTKKQFLGGNLGGQVIVPFVHMNVKTAASEQDKTGMGDVEIGLFDSWHFKNWHFAFGPELFVPVGDYDEDDMVNIGRNYFTIEPVFAVTYLGDGGFEVSSKFMYDINTENKDTDYKSGQEFHFDAFAGYHTGPYTVGINGYYYKQITDDELDGEKYLDGNKGQAVALGPELKYDYKNMAFHLKYHHEFNVENKPETDRFWFKFVYAF